MSDRTRLTEPTETGAGADDTPLTRADRVMGRGGGPAGRGTGADRPGGGSGEPVGGSRSGSGSSGGGSSRGSSGNGSAGNGSAGRGSSSGRESATQRPTSVGGTASRGGSGADADRPTDGWGRTTSPAGTEPAEDETPTRVNPVVPSFRTPLRDTSGRSGGSGPEGSTTTTGTAAAPAVGAGSLGTVTRSMEEPTGSAAPAAATQRAGQQSDTETVDVDASTPAAKPRPRKARRARLRLSRIDPWSVMKTSFLFSIALGIASWVAVAFIWWVIQQSGLFGAVNQVVTQVLQTPGDADPFRLEAYVNGSRVLGLTAMLAVLDVILITAILTVASFLYNLSATMLGGLQVTLAETDD